MTELINLIPKLCEIRNKEGGIIPFNLLDWQKEFISSIDNRNIVLKARQIGCSTTTAAILYLKTIAKRGINSKIIANKKEIAEVLLQTVRILHNGIPEEYRPKCTHETRFEFFFEETQSRLSISSSSKDAGRGETIHNLLCSEVAFWDNAEETMMGLMECVPKSGLIIVESTPNGVGNWFHKNYVKAQQKEIDWKTFRYDYTVMPEYNSEQWKAEKIKEKGEAGFNQEYGCDFVMSQRQVMPNITFDFSDPRRVELYSDKNIDIIIDPVTGKEIDIETAKRNNIDYDAHIDWTLQDSDSSPVRMWKECEAGERYVIGADVAEGLAKGDYSCAYVLKSSDMEVVACWHGHTAPDKFGTELVKLARYYNNAEIGCEVNNHGLATLNKVKELYDNIYFTERYDEIANNMTRKIGWQTNLKTKPLMISDLHEALRERHLTVKDEQLHSEIQTYVYNDNGSTNATEGCYDDRIIALAIALQVYKSMV